MTPLPPVSVSVIVPAYEAEPTIARTLDSIAVQSESSWEIIVIDDGSGDGTADVVERYAARDDRIRLLRQANAGPSAARNAGIAAARNEWLLFLDADDWVERTLFDRISARLAQDPSLDVVHYGWRRVWPDGALIDQGIGPDGADLFPAFARHCALMMHAAVARKRVVIAAGGFDPSMRAAEDWLLWQRIARLGARFGRIEESLAIYCCREGSLSRDVETMARACRRVFELGHTIDPALPAFSTRVGTSESRRSGIVSLVGWLAGSLAGSGHDPADLIEWIPSDALPGDPTHLASAMCETFGVAAGRTPDWPGFWPRTRAKLERFVAGLERKVGFPRFGEFLLQRLERQVAIKAGRALRATVGTTLGGPVEVTQPIDDIEATGVNRLVMSVSLEGVPIGEVDLPVFGDRVSRGVVLDAIADRFSWTILGAYFRRTRYRDVTFHIEANRWSAWREHELLWSGDPGEHDDPFWAFHDQTSWGHLLGELWGTPSAAEPLVVDDDTVAVLEITQPIPAIHASGSRAVVEARLAGCAIAHVSLPVPSSGGISPEQIRAAIGDRAGYEICRVAVREAVIGWPLLDDSTLNSRLRSLAGRTEAASPPVEHSGEHPAAGWDRSVSWALSPEPTVIVGRRLPHGAGSAADRRASLPLAAMHRLIAAESRAGTPIIQSAGQEPVRAYYAPELFTPDRSMGQPIARPVGGEQGTLAILMYHRVAPAGVADRDRWRVTPEQFELQLAALRSAGVRTATFDEWHRATAARRPIPGPAVILTFDDAFLDFDVHARPLLAQYRFGASVFVVTGSVGHVNTWDRDGHVEPLLGWDHLGRLRDEGIELGSHTVSHSALTLLSPDQIFDELLDSRIAIERRLGQPVLSIAYPYGDVDQVTRHLAGAAGYRYGLTCRPGPASLTDSLLDLPRIEVRGDLSADELLSLVGLNAAADR